jgi:hypothetical protein
MRASADRDKSKSVKIFRRLVKNVWCGFENAEERQASRRSDLQKTGCRRLMSREFRSKCAGGSAAKKPQIYIHRYDRNPSKKTS